MSTIDIRAKLTEDIKALLAQELMLEPDDIDLEQDIVDYGVDSLTIALFISDLEDKIGVEITPAIILGSETINEIVSLILEEYQQEVSAYYQA